MDQRRSIPVVFGSLLCSLPNYSFTNLVIAIVDLEPCGPEVVVSHHVIEQSQARFPQNAPGHLVVIGVPGMQPERILSLDAIHAALISQAIAAYTDEALCLLDGPIQKVRHACNDSCHSDNDVCPSVGRAPEHSLAVTSGCRSVRCRALRCRRTAIIGAGSTELQSPASKQRSGDSFTYLPATVWGAFAQN